MDNISVGIKFDNTVVIAVDFDGTLTKRDNFPDTQYIYNFKAIQWLKKIQTLPVIIILWSCNNQEKIEIIQKELKQYEIVFDYINNYGSIRGNTRKINADVYIDDRANDGKIRWRKIYRRIKKLCKQRRMI